MANRKFTAKTNMLFHLKQSDVWSAVLVRTLLVTSDKNPAKQVWVKKECCGCN